MGSPDDAYAPRSFTLNHLDLRYAGHAGRFICALLIGYSHEADGCHDVDQCLRAARDFCGDHLRWWVHDRITGDGMYVEPAAVLPEKIDDDPEDGPARAITLNEIRSWYLDDSPAHSEDPVDFIAAYVTVVDLPAALTAGAPVDVAMVAASLAEDMALDDGSAWSVYDIATGSLYSFARGG